MFAASLELLSASDNEVVRLRGEVQSLSGRLVELSRNVSTSEYKYNDLLSTVGPLKYQCEAHARDRDLHLRHIDSLQARINAATEETIEAKRAAAHAQIDMRQQIEQYKEEIQAANRQCATARDTIAQQQQQIEKQARYT